MPINIDRNEIISALQSLQERYEALANEHESLKTERRENALSTHSVLPQLQEEPDENVRRHIQQSLKWRKKNPWAILKSIFYARKIKQLHLFDYKWYQQQYLENGSAHQHPFRHFLRVGLFEGRSPSKNFDAWFYLKNHLPKLNPGEPAIFHYIRAGRLAGLAANKNQYTTHHAIAAIASQAQNFSKNSLALIENQNRSIHELKTIYQNLALQIKSMNEWHIQHENNLKALAESEEKAGSQLCQSLTKDIQQLGQLTKNEVQQLQNQISIQNYLDGNNSPLNYRGWPISPDIGLFIINRLIENNYDLIIEFGSGTSTVLIARTLQKKQAKNLINRTKFISFEHLDEYWKKTQAMLEYEGVTQQAHVIHAPLAPFRSENGTVFSYYDCKSSLSHIQKHFDKTNPKILILVDGPPGSTNPLARLPALELVAQYFPKSNIELILDDYNRTDEKLTAQEWENFCKIKKREFSLKRISTEKGTALIHTKPDFQD